VKPRALAGQNFVVIFVIIESGMALFAVQLIRFVFVTPKIPTTIASAEAYFFIVAIHEMLTVIILSIICYFIFY
jgi:hypothetical protein